jgi:hypothetical protein
MSVAIELVCHNSKNIKQYFAMSESGSEASKAAKKR